MTHSCMNQQRAVIFNLIHCLIGTIQILLTQALEISVILETLKCPCQKVKFLLYLTKNHRKGLAGILTGCQLHFPSTKQYQPELYNFLLKFI